MGSLLWFNPQNDLALAADVRRFTPPANASRLAIAGQLLPIWYGAVGDRVLVSAPVNWEWLSEVKDLFGLSLDIYQGDAMCVERCEPWGWSLDACSRFADVGVDSDILPSCLKLKEHRLFSHRRTSAELMTRLRELHLFNLPPTPVECRTVSECMDAIDRFEGIAFAKLPFSSTGRGVFDLRGLSRRQIVMRVEAMLRRQHSVMIEKGLEKIKDFAMLFRLEAGKVGFIGYSAFEAVNGTAYAGNLIMPDDEIRNVWLGRHVDSAQLKRLELILPEILTELVGGSLSGYFGVDMMLYADRGKISIDPCVEINLRMTMGVVAHILGARYINCGTKGRLSVAYNRTNPLVKAKISDGKLVEGEISLIEPNPHFSITLKVN